MAVEPKYGGVVKITSEMMESILGLPTGVRLVDVQLEHNRDVVSFKLHSAGPTSMTERVHEGQEYRTMNIQSEDITRVRIGLTREVFE